MVETEITNVIIITLTTFLFSAFIMPLMKRIAHHIGAIDVPRQDEENRHIHKEPIPKLGGVGIFLSFLLGYMLFGVHSIQMNAILIGSFIIVLTGVIDDIKSLRASQKLIGQLAAACVIVFYGKILLNDVTAFGFAFDFGLWSYPLTILFIVGCINVINLIDGLDGLSGGITSIFYLTIGIIAFFQGRYGTLEMTLAFIMLGSTLGFLLYNFYPAQIFAGDCSMFMGFIIAVISLLGFKGTALTSLFVPLTILGIPILDTFFAIIRRILKKQPPFQADRGHLHHQLLGMNFSHRTTVLIIYGINILFALASIFYQLKDPLMGKILYILLFLIVLWFVLTTSIISDKSPEAMKTLETKVKETVKRKTATSKSTKKKHSK